MEQISVSTDRFLESLQNSCGVGNGFMGIFVILSNSFPQKVQLQDCIAFLPACAHILASLALKEASVDALYLGYIEGAPWRSSFAQGL
eukprot:5632947-Amphidinium_carterae.1